jgi:hypothetical protein
LTFLDTPAESRKVWASKASFSVDFLLDFVLREVAISRIKLPLRCRTLHHDMAEAQTEADQHFIIITKLKPRDQRLTGGRDKSWFLLLGLIFARVL